MCDDCGCGDPSRVSVELQESLLAQNDSVAQHNREHFLEAGVLSINLMGSPGAGKTALLEATARRGSGQKILAISGDLATDKDAQRLRAVGVACESITTGTACHLDATMVHHALHGMDWRDADWFFIENVGNLVCPAVYDLGAARRVVALSVTEGEDKPVKYPPMFYKADLVLLTKCDLLPHLDVDVEVVRENLEQVSPGTALLPLSSTSGQGLDEWLAWLESGMVAGSLSGAQTAGTESAAAAGHSHS